MTHKELVAELANRMDWTQANTSKILESAVEIISETLADSNSVSIQGFGSFETRLKQERISVNPVSKQRFMVPPKITPAFRPGQTIKAKIKNL